MVSTLFSDLASLRALQPGSQCRSSQALFCTPVCGWGVGSGNVNMGRRKERKKTEEGERLLPVPCTFSFTQVMLNGPNNPYEVTFYSLTNAGKHRPVRVEKISVNSVVIDNEPQDHHERLMISAHVQLNPSGNACITRDTTLLPNIHGLPFLVSMLFAPCIEMRSLAVRD